MRTFVTRCLMLATVALLVGACGSDTATAPTGGVGTPLVTSNAISNDLAVSAGNSIASDLESMSANEVAAGVDFGTAAGTFDILPGFDTNAASSTPSTANCTFDPTTKIYTCTMTKPETGWECKLNTATNLYTCTRKQSDPPPTTPAPAPPPSSTPTPSKTNSCTYDAATRIYTCIKTAPDAGWECVLNTTTKLYTCTKKVDSPPVGTSTPKPNDPSHPSEVCLLDPVTHLYTCTRSNHDSSTTVRSYGYFDIDGNPMATFVKGTTASIRYITRFDGMEAHDSTYTSVSHQLRDLLVSGFLGTTRIWNGTGSSTDTTMHREGASSRTYTGTSVDTLNSVTYAEERSTNRYPLSGTQIRVMNYTVVSIGRSTETRTVNQRAVVTFNGTKDVPIQLGVFTCTLHLDSHKVDGCK